MSAASSLTYNYDKDSFEEGTFEDISELSLEEVDDEDSEFDEHYEMEVERTRIIMPQYSGQNKKSLRTLIEEQKNDEAQLGISDNEEVEKLEIGKNEIDEINRTSDEEDLDESDTDYNDEDHKQINENTNENEEDLDDSDTDINDEEQTQFNNDHGNKIIDRINRINDDDDDEEDTSDSDDMDVEMTSYSKLSEATKNIETISDVNEKSRNNTDTEDGSDSHKEDKEINHKICNTVDKIGDYSDELLLDNEEDKSYNEEDTTNSTSVELEISSKRPSSFNSDDNAYHLEFIKKSQTSLKSNGQQKSKNLNRNLSFSNDRLRDIERQNKILLQRILTKKPTYENLTTRNSNKNSQANRRVTSAAINRKKQQHQIDLDNQILKRKLEAIALRRHAKQ